MSTNKCVGSASLDFTLSQEVIAWSVVLRLESYLRNMSWACDTERIGGQTLCLLTFHTTMFTCDTERIGGQTLCLLTFHTPMFTSVDSVLLCSDIECKQGLRDICEALRLEKYQSSNKQTNHRNSISEIIKQPIYQLDKSIQCLLFN